LKLGLLLRRLKLALLLRRCVRHRLTHRAARMRPEKLELEASGDEPTAKMATSKKTSWGPSCVPRARFQMTKGCCSLNRSKNRPH
jgi:hypothetical protein